MVLPEEQPAKSVTTHVYVPGDKLDNTFVFMGELLIVLMRLPDSSYH